MHIKKRSTSSLLLLMFQVTFIRTNLSATSFWWTFDYKKRIRMNDGIILFPANVINIIFVNNNRFESSC